MLDLFSTHRLVRFAACACAIGCVDTEEPRIAESLSEECVATSKLGDSPDESCPDLGAIVGEQAADTFVLHRELRARGVDPDAESDAPGVTYAVTKRTIYGYVRDAQQQPMAGFRVQAFDADDLDDDDYMGEVFTDANGYYELHYDGGHWDPCPHEITCWRPDIYIVVSARTWIDHGSVYTGPWGSPRPICSNLEYAWQTATVSSEHSDWRHDDPLPLSLVTPPRAAIWQDSSDKPACVTGPFCKTFVSIHAECFAVVERLQGCTSSGEQYEWFAPCLFATNEGPGVYGQYVTGSITRCRGEPWPWPPSSCTRGESLEPVDDGRPSFMSTAYLIHAAFD